MYLETNRLYFREFTIDDLWLLDDLNGDPSVMKYLTGRAATTDENKLALNKKIEICEKFQGRLGYWAAFLKEGNQFTGWFHFRPGYKDPDNLKRIELGYRLKKVFWGSGLATEGSLALIKKGFEELGVTTIFAHTMANNIGSRKVMEKCGLKFSHSFRDPDYPDSEELEVEYSLLNE
jgi:RimJ/RimL family protein N-acetyltransferase